MTKNVRLKEGDHFTIECNLPCPNRKNLKVTARQYQIISGEPIIIRNEFTEIIITHTSCAQTVTEEKKTMIEQKGEQ